MEESRVMKFWPKPGARGRQLLGLLSGDATDEEIEEFYLHIKQAIEQAKQEQAKADTQKPRRRRAKNA